MKLSRKELEGKIIDCHSHTVGIELNNAYDYLYPVTSDLVQFSEIVRKSKIDYAITFPMPTPLYFDIVKYRSSGIYTSTGLGEYPFEFENKTLLAQISKFNINNILPFAICSLNANVEQQVLGIEQLCEQSTLYGIKYHTMTDQHSALDFHNHSELMGAIRKYNLPVLFHSGKQELTHPNNVLAFAKENPDISFAIIDEKAARTFAASMLVDTLGILGLLSYAKSRGKIEAIRPFMEKLIKNNYRISNAIYNQFLKKENEL